MLVGWTPWFTIGLQEENKSTLSKEVPEEELLMKTDARPDLQPLPMLPHEILYVGIDIGKRSHVAGFISPTLLARHQRFEACPALSFEHSREGFRSLIDRIQSIRPADPGLCAAGSHRSLPSGVAPIFAGT